MTTSWELLAKNHLVGRSWDSIKSDWKTAAVGYQLVATSDLSPAVEAIVGADLSGRQNAFFFNFPGKGVASFQDAMVSTAKCAYILRCVGNGLVAGQPTWASVDAYHFSLLACRALLGLLGVYFVQIGDTHCVLDIFPEGATERDKRGFSKTHRALTDPAKLIFRQRSSVIEQRAMWTILARVLRVIDAASEFNGYCKKIDELGSGFAKTRNEILYRNNAWLYDIDNAQPAFAEVINDDISAYADLESFFTDNCDANFAFSMLMLRALNWLMRDIEQASGIAFLTTAYTQCMSNFSGFSIAKLHDVYSSVFQTGAYSIKI